MPQPAHRARRLVVLIALLFFATRVTADTPTTLPSFAEPAISPDGSEIAFSCGGDIWTAPAAGGTAHLLITHPAHDARPVYSPDGKRLAFVSTRSGNGDVYLFDFDTGDIKRLTWDDGREELDGFSSDGKWVYYSTTSTDVGGSNHDIYRVSVDGGTPMPTVADRFANEYQASPKPDGTALAFCSGGIMAREWYRKGHNHAGESQVCLMRPGKANGPPRFETLTPAGSRDLWPLWSADGDTIYYVSDRDGPQNLWSRPAADEGLSAGTPLTHFTNGRVAWPSITHDGRTIVFERNFAVWKVDTRTGQAAEVPIKLRGATAGTAPQRENFGSSVREMDLSPDGKKIAFVAHGQAFATSAREGGDALRLTHAAGTVSHVTWAHDSRRLVYVSDRDGPRHLYLYDFVSGKETRLTRGGDEDASPRFSPDDSHLAFERNGSELRLLEMKTRRETVLAKEQGFERAPFDNAPSPYVFSPHGEWIAFNSVGDKGFSNLWVVSADGKTAPRQVSFLANAYAHSVSWSPDGTYLLYGTGQRTEEYQLAKIDLIPRTPRFREDQFRDLFREIPRPTPSQPRPSLTERPPTTGPSTRPTTSPLALLEGASTRPATAPSTAKVVFEGIRQRMTLLPVGVDVDFETISPDGKTALIIATAGGQQNLYTYSLDEFASSPAVARQITSSSGSKGHAQFSPDGKEVFFVDGGRISIVPLDTRNVRSLSVAADIDVDFEKEKRTVFRQAWTYLYDNFFDPNFTAVDWVSVKDTYQPRINGVRTPDELRRVLSLMIGELNASHLSISAPNGSARSSSGHLGVRWDAREYERNGKLRVAEIFPLGPAAVAGVKVGDYLLSVDAVRVTKNTNLDETLNLKAGKRVTLRVAPGASAAAEIFARDVPLQPIDGPTEKALLYRSWIESRRAIVDKASNGRLGYVHLSDMSDSALARLNTDLDAETQLKEGVVVDVRGNTGGFVNGFAIDVFARRNYLTMHRRGFPSAPSRVLLGQRALLAPTILLTNRNTYSDGEDFTEGYRALHIGKTVGEPTGGSVIFTSIVSLLDGTRLGLPTTAVYDGHHETLERHPRPVDVAVDRPVGEWYTGQDAQLSAAVVELLKQVDTDHPAATTTRPATTQPSTTPATTSRPSITRDTEGG